MLLGGASSFLGGCSLRETSAPTMMILGSPQPLVLLVVLMFEISLAWVLLLLVVPFM
jgi:hypothetical protein